MGQMYEYEGMDKKEASSDMIVVADTKVNSATMLKLCVIPLACAVMVGDSVVCQCNQLANAFSVYEIMQKDLRCEVWHGNESKT